jgi:A/G-specific adenine glycosylase
MRRFPTVRALAAAPLASVLSAWQGLGYNRRAKNLHEAAKAVVKLHGGRMPKEEGALRALPGVGPYTASAVMAFAYDARVALVETNVRTVFFHHLDLPEKVSDKELLALVMRALPEKGYREWYSALMDYGAHLKAVGVRTNARSAHYKKQPAFAGSLRQARGAVLRALAEGPAAEKALLALAGEKGPAALSALLSEGLVVRAGRRYRLPD